MSRPSGAPPRRGLPPWLVALAVFVLAVGGWLVFGPSTTRAPSVDEAPDRDDPTARESRTGPTEPGRTADPAPELDPASLDDPNLGPLLEVIDDLRKAPVRLLSRSRTETDRALLRVVDPESRRVPNAGVAFIDPSALDPADRDLPRASPEREAALLAAATTLRTNDFGEVLLPRYEADARVLARSGSRSGERRLGQRDLGRTVRLVLVDDRALVIEVTDGAGRPAADVPVGVFARDRTTGRVAARALRLARTEADGRARISGIDALLRRESADARTTFQAALAIPVREPIEVPLALDGSRDDGGGDRVLSLVLPQTGSLRIDLLADDGTPYESPVDVFLGTRLPYESGSFQVRERVRGGRLDLPFVETGIEFAGWFEPASASLDVQRVDLAGPARPGETAVAEVRLDRPSATLTATLHGPDGPLSDVEFTMAPTSSAARFAQYPTVEGRTDARGRARVPISFRGRGDDPFIPDDLARIDGLRVEARDGGPGPAGDRALLSASVAFEAPEPGESIELGRVDLDAVPLLVAGTVVDPDGLPIEGARVVAGAADSDVTARSDATGAFRVRGTLDPSRRGTASAPAPAAATPSETAAPTVLRAFARGHRMAGPPMAFAPGDEDAVVVLERTTTLEGHWLLPEGAPPESIEMTWTEGDRARSSPIPRDGRFRIEYSRLASPLSLRAVADAEPSRSFGFGVVLIGAINDVGTIDVRDGFRAFTVTILDADGEPVRDVELFGLHGRRRPLATTDASGRATLVTGETHVDVEIVASGFEDRVETLRPVDQDLFLDDGARLELRLTPDSETPPAPYRLAPAILRPDGSDAKARRIAPAEVDAVGAEGSVSTERDVTGANARASAGGTFAVPLGRYSVQWMLRLRPSAGERGAAVNEPVGRPKTVELSEPGTVRRLESRIDAAALEDAIARAERKRTER